MPALPQGKDAILKKNDDDVVIVSALRTPITKAKKGGLSQACPEELLGNAIKGVLKASGVDPKLVEDVAVGNVLPPGGGATVARMGALWAGLPNTTAVNTLNRQCSSGLATVNQIANQIYMGQIDIGIGAGVESMTNGYGAGVMPEKMSEAVMENEEASDCLLPMGITSENVAREWKVSREKQDAFAAASYAKAAAAQKAGKFKSEIVVVKYNDEEGNERTIEHDDGIREGVTAESLAKLKPAFDKNGSTHAGNASQISDGAAAVLLARRSVAKKLGLPIIGKFVTATAVGVAPNVMGIGPAFAIPKVLSLVGLTTDDIDIFEINEAFASQAVMSVEHLKLDPKKVNPVGGAIAMGHPLGCTGSRQIATALAEAKRENKKLIVTSIAANGSVRIDVLVLDVGGVVKASLLYFARFQAVICWIRATDLRLCTPKLCFLVWLIDLCFTSWPNGIATARRRRSFLL